MHQLRAHTARKPIIKAAVSIDYPLLSVFACGDFNTLKILDGERIAQLIVTPVIMPDIEEASELSDTLRGTGGFGSTGIQG